MTEQRTNIQGVLCDLLFDEAGVGLCLVAPDSSIVRANAEWLRSTGYALDQVIGEDILDLFPDTRDMALAMHARARAGHRVEVPRHAQVVNGRETWWEGSIAPVPMDGGTGLLITAVESRTPGRGGEALLDGADEILNLGDALCEVDAEYRVIRVNANQERISGTPRAVSIGRVLWDVWPAAARPDSPYWTEYHRCMEQRVAVEFHAYYPPRDLWTAITAYPLVGGGIAIFSRDITGQKRAEEALRESEEHLRLAQRSASVGVWDWQPKAGANVFSPEMNAMYGVPPGTVKTYQDWRQRVHPEDITRIEAERDEAIARREPFDLEFRILHGSGQIKWFAARGNAIFDHSGALDRVIGINIDITRRKRAEEELKAVLEVLPAGVYIARDRDALRIDANPAGLELLRVARGHNVSKSAPAAEAPAYRVLRDGVEVPAAELPAQRAARGEEVRDWECEIRFEDGASRHILGYATPLRDEAGTPTGSVTAFVEITERKRAEEAVRASEAALDAFFAGSPGILNLDDDQLRYLKTDSLTPKYFGLTRESIVGKAVADLAPEFIEEFGPMLKRVIDTGEPALDQEVYSPVAGRPGEVSHWRASYFPVPLPGGRRGIGVMGVDVTDMKRAEAALRAANEELYALNEKLRAADRSKDEWIGMLSHELRNPLAPIRNCTYILQHAEAGSEQARRAQEVIQRQAEHLTRLVDDLLDVTRIARGKIELRRSRVDLREVVWRASDDFRLVLRDRGVRFEIDIPEAHLWADADATRVTQVVGNLLHNASKFTERGDTVTLSMAVAHGSAEIRVRDTGAGVEPELLPQIFEPFVQGERTLARTDGGLGLGLALVKGIVELHGGSVHADSAGKGKGAEFTVRFPILTLPGGVARPELPSKKVNGGHRVLVVDDNHDAAESLAELVRMLGHSVEVAFDGPSAIEVAKAGRPDMVLCDIGLPGMDGYEVARALRAVAPGIQLIAVSGYAQVEDVKKAIDAGFDGHIAKPADPAQIEKLLA